MEDSREAEYSVDPLPYKIKYCADPLLYKTEYATDMAPTKHRQVHANTPIY